jgi:ankyrin repeat protein
MVSTEDYLIDAWNFFESLNGGALIHRLACYPGNIQSFEAFLSEKITASTINQRNKDGDTALMLAVHGGHLDHVKALVKAGADVGASNNAHETPLSYACSKLSSSKILDELLLSPTAATSLAATYSDGHTVLTTAVNKISNDLIRKLLNAKASPHQVNARAEMPLDVLISSTESLSAQKGRNEILQLLLDAGASIGGRDKNGKSLLYRAAIAANAKRIDTDFLKKLISSGANPWVPQGDNRTPFEAAFAANVNDAILITMMSASTLGATSVINKRIDILTTAIKAGREELATAMIKAGADVFGENATKCTPYWCICSSSNLQMAERMIKLMPPHVNRGMYTSSLVISGKVGMLKLHKKLGVSLHWANLSTCGTNTLMKACKQPAAIELAEILIDTDVPVNYLDRKGRTALFYAVESKKPDLVRLLLDNGAVACIVDKDGMTVLMLDTSKEVTDVLVQDAERKNNAKEAAARIVAAYAAAMAEAAAKADAAVLAAQAKAARVEAQADAEAVTKATQRAHMSKRDEDDDSISRRRAKRVKR